MQSFDPAPQPSPPPRSQTSGRSGPRTRLGCLTCRRRKVRCDQSSASAETRRRCGNCMRLELECHFAPPNAPRKRPRRGFVSGNSGNNSRSPRAGMGPRNSWLQYEDSPTRQTAGDNGASSPVLSPSIESQRANSLPQQAAPLPIEQTNLYRTFEGIPGLTDFSNIDCCPPLDHSAGVMSPMPSLYTSSLLPWKDFTSEDIELASNCNLLDNDNTQHNRSGGVTYKQQPQDQATSSPTPDAPHRQSSPTSPSTRIDLALFDVTDHQRQLLLQFTPRINPIPLISLSDSQWKSAYSSLIGLACGCSHLINAICAVSELNLAALKRGSVSQALAYYQDATAKGEAVLNASSAQVDDKSLKQAFATLLLLMHAEIMAKPLAGHHSWPTTRLRTAHRHLRCHSDRLRLWTGVGSHILSWIQIVRSKAIYSAGMEKETESPYMEPSHNSSGPNSTSTDTSSFLQSSPVSNHSVHLSSDFRTLNSQTSSSAFAASLENSPESPLEEPRSAAEIAYDALYEPAYKFFMRCQSFIPRIIGLDSYHRLRGPLDDELEVLQLGQRLRGELHNLWRSRPQGLDVLSDTHGLQDVLHPRVALKVIKSFRSFVANFHAIRIFLHRVAFVQYPASDEVRHAIAEIPRLARDQIADDVEQAKPAVEGNSHRGMFGQHRDGCQNCGTRKGIPSEQPAQEKPQLDNNGSQHGRHGQHDNVNSSQWILEDASLATGGPFPIMLWLWPLFMCGTECDTDERHWILERMYAMRSVNAERTAILLAEVTKRQDEIGKRVDQRSVRQKIFADEFDVVY